MNRRNFFAMLTGAVALGAASCASAPHDANTCVQCGSVLCKSVAAPATFRAPDGCIALAQPSNRAIVTIDTGANARLAFHDTHVALGGIRTCYPCWLNPHKK